MVVCDGVSWLCVTVCLRCGSSGAAGAVGAAALRGARDDQRHGQRGGAAAAAAVPPHLHPPLRERQVGLPLLDGVLT